MILYQYRGPISDKARFGYFADLIRKGVMKFSKPSEFNDPFDFCPTQCSELPPGILPHAVTSELNRSLQQAHSQVSGVACFTTHPDKMLMWSHYGDQHKSVCVGFDSDVLLKQIPKNSEGCPLYSEIRKVEYLNTRPAGDDKEFIFAKSEEWIYEDEYRIISTAQKGNPQWGPGVWEISPSSIKEVIIGAKVEPWLQNEIVSLIKSANSSIELKKVILHTHTYDLVIEKLSDQPRVGRMSGALLGPNKDWTHFS